MTAIRIVSLIVTFLGCGILILTWFGLLRRTEPHVYRWATIVLLAGILAAVCIGCTHRGIPYGVWVERAAYMQDTARTY